NRDPLAAPRQLVEGGLGRGGPVAPGGPAQVLRAGPVTGHRRGHAPPAVAGEVLAQAPQLRRRAGEAVEEQSAAGPVTERPRPDHAGIEGIETPGRHGGPDEYTDRQMPSPQTLQKPRRVRQLCYG